MDNVNKLEEIQQNIVQQITGNMKYYGQQDTLGYVMAIVYYGKSPASLDYLSEKTKMSKTRMSQVMREMTKLNIAEKVIVKGSRKDYYKVESDYYKIFISLITSNLRELTTRNKGIDRGIVDDVSDILADDQVSADEAAIAQTYLHDTKESMAYFKWIERLIDFFESGDVFKYVHAPSNENHEFTEGTEFEGKDETQGNGDFN